MVTGVNAQDKYNGFKVSVYTRAYEVQKMEDTQWLESTWKIISSQLDVDKIYLETHRDLLIVDEETLTKAIKFFESKGIKTAAGITYTIDESNQFETFCYSNPEHLKKRKKLSNTLQSILTRLFLTISFSQVANVNFAWKQKANAVGPIIA